MAKSTTGQKMTDKIFLVTSPDVVLYDGIRILTVDLIPEQTQIVSDALSKLDITPNVIVYIANSQLDENWLLDKRPKADLIIFNADSENNLIVGYLAAQGNSVYFGNLKNLHKVNRSAIYTTDDCFNVIDKLIKQYE